MKKITGIYKLTSPSGKVYIGQSTNIKKRLSYYKVHGCNRQPKLYASLQKYGFVNHKFEMLHELPNDVDTAIINTYEILYISQYKLCGIELLNLTDGGEGQLNPSESTRQKLSIANKGRKPPATAIKRSIAVRRANGVSKETREKMSKSLVGRESPMKGKRHSKDSIEKMLIPRAERVERMIKKRLEMGTVKNLQNVFNYKSSK